MLRNAKLRKWMLALLITVCVLFGLVQSIYIMNCLLGETHFATLAVPEADELLIRNGNLEADCLAFTCNVDWGEEVIPQMLEIFKEKDVHITFFVSGRWAENNPKILRSLYLGGHEIQSHGYSHKLCSKISLENIKEEIVKTQDAIKNYIGVAPTVFAPPAGDYDDKTLELCRDMGYKVSLWSSDTVDWREGSTAEIITKRILDKPLAGAIVLMHPKKETVKALPGLIDEIRLRGIEVVPLCELGVY